MPLYEYKCHRCGKSFEVIRKFSDAPLSVHEGCGGEVEKLVSAAALQFKGTGWYVTDYGRGKKAPTVNGKSESKKDAKTETKTESKPAESKPAPASSDK
jgi:putative FmdB family regulatory protein